MSQSHKSQIASLDLILSAVAILLLLGLIIAAVPLMLEDDPSGLQYGSQVFSNIEQIGKEEWRFLNNYRIDDDRMSDFLDQSYDKIRRIFLAGSDRWSPNDDFCMFFMKDNVAIPPNSTQMVGMTYDSFDHTSKTLCSAADPCRFYDEAIVNVKPVLWKNEIVNLYVVVCR